MKEGTHMSTPIPGGQVAPDPDVSTPQGVDDNGQPYEHALDIPTDETEASD